MKTFPVALATYSSLPLGKTPRIIGNRPSPAEWVEVLDLLMKQRQSCSIDPTHVYYRQSSACPWCRIEEAGGPAFFLQSGGVSIISNDRLNLLDQRIRQLEQVAYPELPSNALRTPRVASLLVLKDRPGLGALDIAAGLAATSWPLCLLGVLFEPLLIASAVLSLLGAGYLLFSTAGKERRRRVNELSSRLAGLEDRLVRAAHAVRTRHRRRASAFEKMAAAFDKELQHYRAEGDQLRDVLTQHREDQKNNFLRQHFIRKNVDQIPGMTASAIVMLESYGVESAYDVDSLKLMGIPAVNSDLNLELLHWRSEIENGFVYKPEHGVSPAELEAAGEQAARRFKAAQARKILMGVVQQKALADAGKAILNRELRQFGGLAEQWRTIAKEKRDFQSRRHRLERSLNRSTMRLAGLTLGVPAIALVLWLIIH